ncbi:MAG: hypothetical protein ACOC7V_11210 [Spirochaetota bacterium]
MLKRKVLFALLRTVLVGVLAVVLAGCERSEPAPEPGESAAEVAPIAAIGGVRDVWAFDFGLDADRERVRAAFGDPLRVEQSDTNEADAGPQIVRWEYDGLRVSFLIDRADEHEYLLTVRISDPELPMRGGLRIGMPVGEAVELLGEPRVENPDSLVYFYRETTIELGVSDGIVETVTLARALP